MRNAFTNDPMNPHPLKDSFAHEPECDVTESMQLVMRHQQGDPEALDRLLDRYQDRIRRIVRIKLGRSLRNHLESADIAQEANLVAMNKMADLKLQDHASIIQWLSKIVLNKIRDANDYFHAQKRNIDRVVNVDIGSRIGQGVSAPAANSAASPVEQAGQSELRGILDEAMIQLPDELREVILLRDYYAADWGYVSRETGIRDVAEVQKLHRRAWISLRRIVGPRMKDML